MAASLLFLCGAVPVTDQQFERPLVMEERLVFCCCCHHVQPAAPQVDQVQQVEPLQLQPPLPDVIPSFGSEQFSAKSALKRASTREDAETPDETDDGKLSAREWRQIGHDLRLIADRFQLERRAPDSSNSQHWFWRTVAQTAAIYVGYRLHRWATGA